MISILFFGGWEYSYRYAFLHGDVGELESVAAVDGEDLNWGVEDGESLDERICQIVGLEELGLGLATRASLSIPVRCTVLLQSCVSTPWSLKNKNKSCRASLLLLRPVPGALVLI